MNVKDAMGARGEALFYTLITQYQPQTLGSLFSPAHLGDKWPMADFVVELRNARPITPFFFVQVKATRLGYTRRANRLKVQVAQTSVLGLVSYPAPTYLVGIDDIDEKGYLVSVNSVNLTSLSSLSTAFPIDALNRQQLWNEVQAYWIALSLPKTASSFHDVNWR